MTYGCIGQTDSANLACPSEDDIDRIGQRSISVGEDLLEANEMYGFVDVAQQQGDEDQESEQKQQNAEHDLHRSVDVSTFEEETSTNDFDRFFVSTEDQLFLLQLLYEQIRSSSDHACTEA